MHHAINLFQMVFPVAAIICIFIWLFWEVFCLRWFWPSCLFSDTQLHLSPVCASITKFRAPSSAAPKWFLENYIYTFWIKDPIRFTYLFEFEPVMRSRIEGSRVQHSKSTSINANTEKSTSSNALGSCMNQKQFI